METAKLKKFAQFARRSLIEQVSTKLGQVLAENSAARRESTEAIKKLEEAIKAHGEDQVIERVAYIWFNRFCALRFMDVNRYTRISVVSPAEGQFQPEILAEAKMGHIDEELVYDKSKQKIFALLDGKMPSHDPQGEAYRLLVVSACNYWHKAMPFLFQRIDDYTELLMPDDLLSGNSILAYTREAMTPDACEDVEVIGWLYQFYISEKKDEVFDGLKKNKKITPENIPAATQLFTPHWIVRYLVENSLGRLWLLNRPGSKLADKMDYYIKPEQAETDFLRITKPEDIKICDPACGSGHMLTYAFDLLYAIYEEEGYEPVDIPEKILTHNLYGVEIDERAGELAAFALTMKARAKQRRFFQKCIVPNICVLENIQFANDEIKEYMDFVGRDLFSVPLQATLHQFEEADNFGSLIRPEVTDVTEMLQTLSTHDFTSDWIYNKVHQKVLKILRQADYLSPKYHVVIANPPYMGVRNMNSQLISWLKKYYSDVKTDLFSAFIIRCSEIGIQSGHIGVMSPNVWMYISSHKSVRDFLLDRKTITNLVELPLSGFKGATVQICSFTFENKLSPNAKGNYIGLTAFKGSDMEMSEKVKEAVSNPSCQWLHKSSTIEFDKVQGRPIAYWLSTNMRNVFSNSTNLRSHVTIKQGMATSDNNRFLRSWSEVSLKKIAFDCSSLEESEDRDEKWYPYNKGGDYRKWYGNNELLVNWWKNGQELKEFQSTLNQGWTVRLKSREFYFKSSITWTDISSVYFGVRYSKPGFIFDVSGSSAFPEEKYLGLYTAFLCSKITFQFLKALNPTLHFQVENIAALPVLENEITKIYDNVNEIFDQCVDISVRDWDSYETSWDFTCLPLIQVASDQWPVLSENGGDKKLATSPQPLITKLSDAYAKLRAYWREMTLEMQRLEEENNRIFIDAYGLQDELTPDVPPNEITLTCNPHYRYGSDKSEEELEALLLADTMRELVSYAVGCIFGRYALDKPGLILANQGETIKDYLKQVPAPSFPADDDNVIPMLDGDWFTDDIVERFRKFLRVAFGEANYEENLQFVEQSLNIKKKRGYTIRDYFLNEFYSDHVKRYKKRPIYWLFSSLKGNFNALIYMHRYRPDTVSVVLNDYLREFRTKLIAEKNRLEAISISASAAQVEKTKALKDIEKLTKMIAEMEEYEREVLYPLATEQVKIDLDDGVKTNYPKFGAALKKILGLDAVED